MPAVEKFHPRVYTLDYPLPVSLSMERHQTLRVTIQVQATDDTVGRTDRTRTILPWLSNRARFGIHSSVRIL